MWINYPPYDILLLHIPHYTHVTVVYRKNGYNTKYANVEEAIILSVTMAMAGNHK